MNKFTVRYQIKSYWYESVIYTTSSDAALVWVDSIGGFNATILREEEF